MTTQGALDFNKIVHLRGALEKKWEKFLKAQRAVLFGLVRRDLQKNVLSQKLLHCKILWSRLTSFPCGSAGKESVCSVGDLGLIPGLGRSPREGNSYPLQYSGLKNSTGCIVPGIAKSQTRLSDFHFQQAVGQTSARTN